MTKEILDLVEEWENKIRTGATWVPIIELPPEEVWPELQQAQRPAAAPLKISEVLNYVLAIIVVVEAIAIVYLARKRRAGRA